ncbi:acetate/propionate family kinase [Poseidonocella sedimentorum]|uniref:Acetate kinase n=1 Tax=Poseidonocella sedimentorum TaxID=871652 RepID=A0A1I6EGF2_9RHOB|nr:acetate kinase [Poseidonocella sedimentorum]SFR16631.1 acetate kinase [Poseidonocella sedimentorum]
MPDRGAILVLNAGSSSLKMALVEGGETGLSGQVDGIGGAARVRIGGAARPAAIADHAAAVDALLNGLEACGVALADLRAAAHRIVHGGARLTAPVRLTEDALAELARNAHLAPLHTPHALAAIQAVAQRAPDLRQCASFDTGFHATQPELATRYALPDAPETAGLRRWGFHGLSYAALVDGFEGVTGRPLPRRLLACHLGNGASLCAILEGRSVATTMGYDPLSGLTMGTRAGEIDAGAVLALADRLGVDGAREMLGKKSGLKALGGQSDMRALLASESPAARFAIAHFTYWAARAAGSMIAAMEGLDAIAFTGGIGEHAAPIRAGILDRLAWTGASYEPALNEAAAPVIGDGAILAAIIPAAEEARIAGEAARLLQG